MKALLAFLQADGIDDRLALHAFQPGLDHRPFRGVDHDRHARDVRLGGDEVEERHHRLLAVEQALVHVDVDDVGAVLHLLARHGQRGVVIARLDQLAEFGRAGDVGALADIDETAAAIRHSLSAFTSFMRAARHLGGLRFFGGYSTFFHDAGSAFVARSAASCANSSSSSCDCFAGVKLDLFRIGIMRIVVIEAAFIAFPEGFDDPSGAADRSAKSAQAVDLVRSSAERKVSRSISSMPRSISRCTCWRLRARA